jgi:flavin-dependent dehydrogenase
MASIVVVGGGMGGTAAALLLARRGHGVIVLERDADPPPATCEEAWESWDRQGVTQMRQSHLFLGRLYQELRLHLPDVLDAVLAAGVHVMPWRDRMPPAIDDGVVRPGDDEVVAFGSRRTTVEHVLRAALARQSGVTLRTGVAVEGLAPGRSVIPGVPHVVGVRTASGEAIDADLVLDVSGRRSALSAWLADLNARPPLCEVEENGLMYFTRWFRVRPGCEFPRQHGSLLADLPYVEAFAFPADNGVFSVTCQAYAADKGMRPLKHPAAFMAGMAAIPRIAEWIDPERSEPITGMTSMAKLEDCYRRYVVDGMPVATGVLALGDSSAYTNPALGRGSSLAFVHARLLAEVLDDTGLDHPALACHLDQLTESEIVPWFRSSVAVDRQRGARMAAVMADEPLPTPDPADTPAVMAAAMRLASTVDPVVFMAFSRIIHLMAQPGEVMRDGDVVQRILDVWERRADLSFEPEGPERKVMVDILAQAAPG